LAAVADGLAERNVATLRYQFPYMEEGSKRPDVPKVAHATVRAAVGEALRLLPGLAVVAGGKSFGGRMTSQAQAASPLPGGQGLAFLGFPLHPAGRPSDERGAHLFEIKIPMLFLQGSRDALATTELIETLVQRLGERATLKLFEDADHSFHVPAKKPGARMRKSDPKCWMSCQPGSRQSCRRGRVLPERNRLSKLLAEGDPGARRGRSK